jgi:hypothetical protein
MRHDKLLHALTTTMPKARVIEQAVKRGFRDEIVLSFSVSGRQGNAMKNHAPPPDDAKERNGERRSCPADKSEIQETSGCRKNELTSLGAR